MAENVVGDRDICCGKIHSFFQLIQYVHVSIVTEFRKNRENPKNFRNFIPPYGKGISFAIPFMYSKNAQKEKDKNDRKQGRKDRYDWWWLQLHT